MTVRFLLCFAWKYDGCFVWIAGILSIPYSKDDEVLLHEEHCKMPYEQNHIKMDQYKQLMLPEMGKLWQHFQVVATDRKTVSLSYHNVL
jgi:hypothetical protein